MALDKKVLVSIVKAIKGNCISSLIINIAPQPSWVFFPIETVSINDMYEILYAMKNNHSITEVKIPSTPCSQRGMMEEVAIVPALISAIKAKAATNKRVIERNNEFPNNNVMVI